MQLLTEDEKETLEKLFVFFEKDYGNVEKLAASYLMIVDDFRGETKYFLEHGRYRNSSYEEVAQQVYYNEIYMEQYMIGLVLSDYSWSNHVKITRWFKEHLESVKGNKYLEIGPGFWTLFFYGG